MFIVLIQLLEGRFYISNITTVYAVLSGRAYSVDVAITEIQLVPNQTGKSINHHGISLGPEVALV